jgi:hypothetical protein
MFPGNFSAYLLSLERQPETSNEQFDIVKLEYLKAYHRINEIKSQK